MSDFASEYGIRLSRDALTWREFVAHLTGLMCADTRLARHFSPRQEDPRG